ncbi:MAG TPA: 1-deoxy-D-xylulose-5-phosphate reductoisomerase [Capsulimonadaceae bacterium]|nr:1-deoxy-D-xylulose-5-phosphate reductoisomerase [Capsulimonadaceae bacterium]
MKNIAVLGSTGSIGQQTLDIVRRLPNRLRVIGLAARSNAGLLAEQALAFGAEAVGLTDPTEQADLKETLGRKVELRSGPDALEKIAARADVDTVVVAVAGAVGTRATLAALAAGKDVALATKEVLVAAGEIVTGAARMGGGRILPIDSEHSGLLQCLNGEKREDVARLWLTASGGPFRGWSRKKLAGVTVQDALQHPTWRMGNKITVDCATLMNKGLEAIEARWLFDMPIEQVGIVVHPQSTVHSLVEFRDGSIIAQLGLPDMRLPIEYALLYPERIDAGLPRLSPVEMGTLTFEAPDEDRFPCLRLAREAAQIGGTMPAVMNGANEVAVGLFLEGKVGFLGIPQAIECAMKAHNVKEDPSLDQVLMADHWARRYVCDTFLKE